MSEVIAPAAPAAPPRRPVTLSGPVARLVLAFVADIACSDDAEHAQLAQSVLGHFIRAADRRDARLDARGQLRLLDLGPRTYPSLPRLRRRRRRSVGQEPGLMPSRAAGTTRGARAAP